MIQKIFKQSHYVIPSRFMYFKVRLKYTDINLDLYSI